MEKNNDTPKNNEKQPLDVLKDTTCVDVDNSEKKLNAIYKNVTMSSSAVDALLPYANGDLLNELKREKSTYLRFANEIERLGDSLEIELKPISKMSTSMADMGIKMKMTADDSNGNIAKIMLLGSTNGIIDIYIELHHNYGGVHEKIKSMLLDVLQYEEEKTNLMKKYL